MVVKIVLSADCDECCNHRGGQCRLDANKMFYCHNGTFQINFWTIAFLLNVSLISTHNRRMWILSLQPKRVVSNWQQWAIFFSTLWIRKPFFFSTQLYIYLHTSNLNCLL
jgi:hypothetical protein